MSATDLATLGLEIRSDGVVVAKDRLQDFEQQAGKTSKATDLLLKAFGALAAVFSVAKLIEYTNTWTDLNSRIEIATGSIGRGVATMERLDQMARRTYSSLELTVESFLRNSTAMRDLGYSTEQTLDFVESINNALVVSGTKGERAESVMNALGKAMALGKLSGDELNTVISTGGRIAEALAESLGVTTLALRKLGADGKLTGDVIFEGLTSQLQTLREEADSMPATIGDAFVLLNNSVLASVGRFDEMTGASSRVAEAIIWVADAIGDGTISIERLVAVATVAGTYMAGAWVVSFVAAYGAVASLTAGLVLLRTALIRTGIGALVVLAGELVYQLFRVVEGSNSVGDAFGRLKKSGVDTWERVVAAGEYMWHSLVGYARMIEASFTNAWAGILSGLNLLIRAVQDGYNAMATTFGQPTIDFGFAGVVEGQTQLAAEAYKAGLDEMAKAREAFNRMFEDKSTATGDLGTMPGFDELKSFGQPANDNMPTLGEGKAGKADAYDRLTKSIRDNIEALKVEAEALSLTEFEATKLSTAQELMRAAAEAKRPLTEELIADINAMAQAYAEAEQIVAGVQLAIGNPEPWDILRDELASLDAALQAGMITWQQYQAAATKSMAGAAATTLGTVSQITGILAGAFQDSKALAVANAVVNTAEGVTKAIAQGGIFAFPMAAAIAAAGAVQIGTIMSASPSGGSSGSVSVPSAPVIANAPQRQQAEREPDRLDVTLKGLDKNALYNGETVEKLIQLLEERSSDGRILNIKVA